MKTKYKTSIMLTAEAKRLLRGLANDAGISQGAMLEQLIRERAVRILSLDELYRKLRRK